MIRDIELRLDITNACNMHCIMCHLPYEHKSPRAMSLDEFKLATEGILHRVNVLFLSWTTEPLLNKALPAILAYVRECKVPCVTLVTNLTILTEELADAFVNNGLHRINVSIDAADRGLYAVIRQRDCFEKVIENVRRIQELKTKRGSRFPIIAINAVLLKMNLHQLHPIIDLCVSLKINELNCSAISVPRRYNDRSMRFDLKGLPPDFNLYDELLDYSDESIQNLLRNALRYAESKRVLLSVPGRFSLLSKRRITKSAAIVRSMAQKAVRFPFRSIVHLGFSYMRNFFATRRALCSYPWRQLVVTAEGEVLPCCVWDEASTLGKIGDTPLLDIWNGDALKKMRHSLSQGNPPGPCRQCTRMRSKKRHGL